LQQVRLGALVDRQRAASGRPQQIVDQARSVLRTIPDRPVDRVQVGAQRVLKRLAVVQTDWEDGWAPALLLCQFVRLFDLTFDHLTVDRLSREEGDQEIGLANLSVDTLGPGRSYRHDLVDEDVVLLAQGLADRQRDRLVGIDTALVADKDARSPSGGS
jgi:hypothetical protein